MLPVAKQSSVVIIGDGPMGLIHLQLFKRLSSSRVAIVGKIPSRMEKSTAMGADAVFAYSPETVADVLDFAGDSSGAGAVVVATSNPVAFDLATKVLRQELQDKYLCGHAKRTDFFIGCQLAALLTNLDHSHTLALRRKCSGGYKESSR